MPTKTAVGYADELVATDTLTELNGVATGKVGHSVNLACSNGEQNNESPIADDPSSIGTLALGQAIGIARCELLVERRCPGVGGALHELE